VLILIILYVISQQLPIRAFCGTGNFRRGDLYETRLTQTISREGYLSEEGEIRVLVKWSGLIQGSGNASRLRPFSRKQEENVPLASETWILVRRRHRSLPSSYPGKPARLSYPEKISIRFP
jgi:hypothetical protein